MDLIRPKSFLARPKLSKNFRLVNRCCSLESNLESIVFDFSPITLENN